MMNDGRKILEVIVFCNETIMLKSKTPSMVNQNKQSTAIHNIPEVCSSGVQAAFAGSMFRYPRAMQSGHAVGSESARQRSLDAHVKCCLKKLAMHFVFNFERLLVVRLSKTFHYCHILRDPHIRSREP